MAFILPFNGVPNAYYQCDYQWSYYYADTGVVTLAKAGLTDHKIAIGNS